MVMLAIAGYLIAGVSLVLLGIWSVQSLIQAALLRRCRTASLAGLAGGSAALCGPVKVRHVLRIAHLGDVLWHREIVMRRNPSWMRFAWRERVMEDTAGIADFSIIVGGEPVWIAEAPTEVQGAESRTTEDEPDALDLVLGSHKVVDEWLPVVKDLTVVGRLRRGDAGWEMARDLKAGLFVSVEDPIRAARWESIKGWLGLAGALAGLVTLTCFVTR